MSPGAIDETAPPKGAHAMAIVRWALVAVMVVVAAGSVLRAVGFSPGGGAGTPGESGQQYYCPMHPQIVRDGPGECPICSMALVPKPKSAARRAATTPADAGASAAGQYHCPMHPEVASDDPNAECGKCGGMKLVPRPGEGAAASAGVPGLVPVELSAERVQQIGMRTATVARETTSGTLRAAGVLAANERKLAQVTTRFDGFVEKLLVAETGARVRRGQPLALVYSPEALRVQQELITARSWKGTGSERQSDHLGGHGLDQAARRRLELLGVQAAEIDEILRTGRPLPALPVRSPVDGHVIGKNAVLGGAVQSGVPLYEIADLSTLWLMADVAEANATRLRIGQAARLELSAYPGESFPGKVEFVYPTIDPETRTLRARIALRNRLGPTGLVLRPGMYGTVTLEVPGGSALVVPAEALVDTGEAQYVFVAKGGGRFEPRRVRRGASAGDKIAILEGLAAGETVVTTANFLLDSESRLRAAVEGHPAGGGQHQHQH